jgi:prepilin-type N-terminal cleavage/methylation domain-containing protein
VQKGFSLIEVMIVVAVMAVCTMVAVPPYAAMRDGLAVDGAGSALVRALADARNAAQRRSERIAVEADTTNARLVVHSVADTLLVTDLRALFGVALRASRDSIAYSGTGLGYGAANVTYVVSRGQRADTVTVSRAGRVLR